MNTILLSQSGVMLSTDIGNGWTSSGYGNVMIQGSVTGSPELLIYANISGNAYMHPLPVFWEVV